MSKQRTKAGSTGRPETGATEGAFPADLKEEIGRRLRAHYDSILAAPIPGRIAALLERLGEGEETGEG